MNIKYFYQINSGKPSAVNRGISKLNGKYFLVLDSDDEVIENAIETFFHHLEESTSDIIAVGALTQKENGDIIGSHFPQKVWKSTMLETVSKYNLKGDKWLAFKSEPAKLFSYPILENEKLIPEGVVFNRMARAGFKILFIDISLLIHEYSEDGISKNINNIKKSNPLGFFLYYFENIISKNTRLNKYYFKNAVAIIDILIDHSSRKIRVFILLVLSLPIALALQIYRKIKRLFL